MQAQTLDRKLLKARFEQRKKRVNQYQKKSINFLGYEINNVPIIKRDYDNEDSFTKETTDKIIRLIQNNPDKNVLNYDTSK